MKINKEYKLNLFDLEGKFVGAACFTTKQGVEAVLFMLTITVLEFSFRRTMTRISKRNIDEK